MKAHAPNTLLIFLARIAAVEAHASSGLTFLCRRASDEQNIYRLPTLFRRTISIHIMFKIWDILFKDTEDLPLTVIIGYLMARLKSCQSAKLRNKAARQFAGNYFHLVLNRGIKWTF